MTHLRRFALAPLLAAVASCGQHPPDGGAGTANAAPVPADTAASGRALQPGSILSSANDLRGTCVVKAGRVVKLKAQLGGEIVQVPVNIGDEVKKGQILAMIDTSNLNIRRERASLDLQRLVVRAELLQFQLAKSSAELEAGNTLARQSDLKPPAFGKEIAAVTEKRIDLRDNELNQAMLRLDLRTLDDQISKAAIRAPYDGVVLSRLAEPGMVVGAASENFGGGEALFELGDPKHLIAACLVREADSALIGVGLNASLATDSQPNKPIPAKIVRISPVVMNDAGLARREFEVSVLDDNAQQLLPGMHAIVSIAIK